jgi:hypothetical protein
VVLCLGRASNSEHVLLCQALWGVRMGWQIRVEKLLHRDLWLHIGVKCMDHVSDPKSTG